MIVETITAAAIIDRARGSNPLSRRESLLHEAHELALSLYRVCSARRRGRAEVMAEYDQGTWARQLKARAWEQASSLSNYVTGDSDTLIVARLSGKLFQVRKNDYYLMRANAIAEIIGSFDGGRYPITELGSGCGMNCFGLAMGGWADVLGLDISENGVAAANDAATFFGLPGVSFRVHDALSPKGDRSEVFSGRTVFTYLCLEQIGSHLERAIANLVADRPRRVIHFENAWEVLSPWSLGDLCTAAHIYASDYQRTLLRVLRRFEANGAIAIEKVGRLRMSPTPKNDLMVVAWTPSGS